MLYAFGEYTLDTQLYELRRAGELIHLGPQVFNVLAYLVQHRHRVVPKQELFDRLWPGQFVGEDALERCIRVVRRTLADRPEAPRYIATNRGRGYRFIAPVQEQPHGPPEDGMLTTVLAQNSPQPPSATGREGPPPPVSLPTVSGEFHCLSEEVRQPALAGEYKQVTVLCGGLADALALARHLGPEAMHRHMQTVFALVHQVLHRYGGSLSEFGGEGFVALFGAPEGQEDHAQRAVLAALALRADVGASTLDLGQAPTEPMALCLGLHTGRVVVERLGGDPPRLYTAAGETTQVALRLRQLAAPGTTLLSEVTQQLVHEHVRVEPRGEVTVSEAQAPMLVYGVREIAQQRSGVVGHGARACSPFVGRACELALLQERLDAAMVGQGQVVALVGEPGMGKSRLLAEFCRGLLGREVRYHGGTLSVLRRCHAVSAGGGRGAPALWDDPRRAVRSDRGHRPPAAAGGRTRLPVPETIEAVLAARIDRLPPEEKRLLQTAAVTGMAVPVPLLQAVTDLAAAELHTHLAHLRTVEFLYETGRSPASAYTFKHALIHGVAYGSLLQERRRVLHGRAAQAIEELCAERLPEHYYVLAHHDRHSGNTAKAVDYLNAPGNRQWSARPMPRPSAS
jgi:DNA-binding winged helix-turn-helix (wHTH) protein/class 3 adenylate cyclase